MLIRTLYGIALCASVVVTPYALQAQARATLIRNASLLDGTGAPARRADVRIRDGRIVAVGTLSPESGDTVVDARGLTLAPGFIDTHSHHDRGLHQMRDALGAVSQGITTIVVGQDGGSRFPLRAFLARLDTQAVAVNVASYVGHGTLRNRVMGDDFRRPATQAEVDRMRELLREEMDAGALGLSTGLEYDPGINSAPGEVLALAKVVAPYGGRYISHMRSEDRDFWQALDELLHIGREARIPVQVSHMKLAMRGLWGRGDSLIRVLDRARAQGIRVTADVYPYTMWQSTLTVLYPKRNFDDRAETEFILREVASPDDLVLGNFELEPSYVGKSVREIAALRKTDPATTLMALIAESNAKNADESVVAKGMDEPDIARIMRWEFTNICSDGALDGAHPRGFGSFPRVLGHYVREQKVMPLAQAVRKMTSLSAGNVGLKERGTIAPGMWADLVLFDPATVGDRATIAAPHAPSVGIATVWVNGVVAYRDGKTTGAYPGRVLRRAAGAPAAASQGASSEARIDSVVRAEMTRQRIPGVAVAVVKNGAIVSARGYGFANVEHQVPVTDATIFQSGSLGKMFTSALAMLLVEEGKLSLNDTIAKFFPGAPDAWRSITVRHLLTHTSGIPDYTNDTFNYRTDYTEDQLAKFAFDLKPEFAAGSRWNYSNTGYVLLGIIIGKAAGRFYGDVMKERVFTPLGMTTARIITEEDIVANRAAGYRLAAGTLKNQNWVAPKLNTTADGSLYFSLRDLLAWESAVRARKLLKPASWDMVLSPVRLNSGKPYPYGFGWSIDTRGGQAMHSHGGAWQGFKTQLSRFLGDDLTIIVLANLAQANPGRIADGVAAALNPALAPAGPATAAIEDREPQVTAHVRGLLESLRNGTATEADFAYMRGGFPAARATAMRNTLAELGPLYRLTLHQRRELGDDRIYLYKADFQQRTMYLEISLAPDNKVAAISMRQQP
jgi:N-acyl-D-amino-acid deacylase